MRLNDALLMGLRLADGIDLDWLSQRYRVDAEAYVRSCLAGLETAGLFVFSGRTVRLTPRGFLLSNNVFSRFV
jgi:oxygen-independent coproporphyrinogen-3 oxidase